MEKTALKTAISYESKLVRRNWLFYLFIFGILVILNILIPWEFNWISWGDVAFASSIPLRGIYFLNLFQALIVTFIICDIQRKRKKAETQEVLSARPISNGQSFLGESLGILIPFLVIDVIFIFACLFINIFTPESPVNLWVHLFYLFTLTLPSLIFITGLSLLVNKLVKHPFVSWIILVAFLYFAYSYLTKPLHGMLDFQGSLLPNSFSTIVGYVYLTDYLLQRGTFLLLGISLFYFAASLIKREPNAPNRKRYLIIPASLFFILALSTGGIYIGKFQTRLKNRIEYRETLLKYNTYPTSRVLSHDITYRPKGDKFSATSQMKIRNQKKIKMDQLLLFLNPGLKINKIESNGQNLPFHRDHQVVVIEHSLAPGENTELEIEYEGSIDEDNYQVNIDDDRFFSPAIWSNSRKEIYGRRRAFVTDEFTLLTPEVMWYPTAVAPVELQASKEINFTDYTLHVENTDDMTVLSQGEPTQEGDNVTFNNVQRLTGLTLCIGKYEKKTITIDSVIVEFYTYPGNSFYLKHFDEWEALKKDNPDREKKLTEISRRCKESIEDRQPNPYPFKYLKLIEVPSSISLLVTRSSSNYVQPEIVLFEERLCKLEETHPNNFTGEPDRGVTVQDFMLDYKIPFYLNQMRMTYIFSNYNSSIISDTYQGIDLIFKQMMSPRESRDRINPKILNHIAEKGVKGIISEGYSEGQSTAISLKVSQLLGYLTTITTWDSLTRFMQEFNARARFQEVNFDSFLDGFEQQFGQNIKTYMDEWYTSHQLPLLSIKDLSYKTTEDTQIIDFKVGNSSETAGIVSIITNDWVKAGGGRAIGYCRSYLIKPGEYKRIIVHEDIDYELKLTTNFSGCLPKDISLDHGEEMSSDAIPAEGVTLLTRDQFYPRGEIIVDNEDENFHLIDSANNRKRLADLIKKEDERQYGDFNIKANAWSLYLTQALHGEHIRSAFVKKAGTGTFKAEWIANLPKAGKYEIFIHRPHIVAFGKDAGTTDYPGMKNYYTVYTPEGKEEIILEVQEETPSWQILSASLPSEESWVSLGKFTLPAGESRVVLDDRGGAPVTLEMYRTTFSQLVLADAVKWVQLK